MGMNASYAVGWNCFRAIFFVYFRWKAYNPERVPLTGPVILASSHASFLDPPLAGVAVHRTINYLARETLFRFPVMGWVLRSWGCVPVNREGGGAAGLRAILERLNQGGAILLFPEGTRSRDGKLQPARPGVGLTVTKSSAPVIPIRVFGTFEAYGRHVRIPRPYPVSVKYGRPLDFKELRAEAATCDRQRLKAIHQQVANEIMTAIEALKPERD